MSAHSHGTQLAILKQGWSYMDVQFAIETGWPEGMRV